MTLHCRHFAINSIYHFVTKPALGDWRRKLFEIIPNKSSSWSSIWSLNFFRWWIFLALNVMNQHQVGKHAGCRSISTIQIFLTNVTFDDGWSHFWEIFPNERRSSTNVHFIIIIVVILFHAIWWSFSRQRECYHGCICFFLYSNILQGVNRL